MANELTAEINALPERLRRFVMELETMADPAGMVRENVTLRDANDAIRAENYKLTGHVERMTEARRAAAQRAVEYHERAEKAEAELATLRAGPTDVQVARATSTLARLTRGRAEYLPIAELLESLSRALAAAKRRLTDQQERQAVNNLNFDRSLAAATARAEAAEKNASETIAGIVEQCGSVVEVSRSTIERVISLTLTKDVPPDRNVIRWRTFPTALAAQAPEQEGGEGKT